MRGRCGRCGEFALRPAVVRLVAYGAQPPTFVLFSCPTCGASVRQDVPLALVRALAEAGVRTLQVASEQHRDGPALTEDDLIAFGLALEAVT